MKTFTQNKDLYLWNSFTNEFGDGEYEESKTILTSQETEKKMTGQEILDTLKPKIVTLGEVYNTLQTADKESYSLFFVKDKNGSIFVVYASWSSDYRRWFVYARDLSDEWNAGSRVFSSNMNLGLEQAIKICKNNGLRVLKTVTSEVEL